MCQVARKILVGLVEQIVEVAMPLITIDLTTRDFRYLKKATKFKMIFRLDVIIEFLVDEALFIPSCFTNCKYKRACSL